MEDKNTPGKGHNTFSIRFDKNWASGFHWDHRGVPLETEPARPIRSKIAGYKQIIDSRSRLWSYDFIVGKITYLPLAYISGGEVYQQYVSEKEKMGFKIFSKKASIFTYILKYCEENRIEPEIFDWDLIKEMAYFSANYTVKRCGDLNG